MELIMFYSFILIVFLLHYAIFKGPSLHCIMINVIKGGSLWNV